MKYVSAAEFKAKCLELMDEVRAGGEPITVTQDGEPVATVIAPKLRPAPGQSIIGALASPEYRFDDPDDPPYNGPWNAER